MATEPINSEGPAELPNPEAFRQMEIANRWKVFTAEFPNDRRLAPSAVYSLPIRLLDLLERYAPGLLSADDQRFERRLRELGGTGFSNQMAFGYEILNPPESLESTSVLHGDPLSQMMRESRLNLHGTFFPNLKVSIPLPDKKQEKTEIKLDEETQKRREDLKQRRQKMQKRINERLQGFAGWLVTNPDYRGEAACLAEEWKRSPDLVSKPPDVSELNSLFRPDLTGSQLARVSELSGKARRFLNKWNLARLETFELPVPISPIEFSDEALPTNDVRSMGISLFIPWSLLSDRDLKFDDIVDYHQMRQDISHLDGWTASGRTDQWGVERHAKIFVLFVYLHCAIKQRYSDQLVGKLGKLDRVFAFYWNPDLPDEDSIIAGAESVRKIRQELQRRLNLIESAV